MDPDERDSWSRVDAGAREVAACTCNNAAHEKTNDDGARFHDRAAKAFAEDDRCENQETETDELGAAPRKWSGSVDVRAEREKASLWASSTATGATSPVAEAGADQLNTDEHDSRASDKWWENALEGFWWAEAHQDFDQRTNTLGTEDCA